MGWSEGVLGRVWGTGRAGMGSGVSRGILGWGGHTRVYREAPGLILGVLSSALGRVWGHWGLAPGSCSGGRAGEGVILLLLGSLCPLC